MKPFFYDDYPCLYLESIPGGTAKSPDPNMLLDPFVEQLDLPAATGELGDGQCRHVEVVGQKDQMSVLFCIGELDVSQMLRVILAGKIPGRHLAVAGVNEGWCITAQGFAANQWRKQRLT